MAFIVKLKPHANDKHDIAIYNKEIPEGWAYLPEDLPTPGFPYGIVQTGYVNQLFSVIYWQWRPERPDYTPADKRKELYSTRQVVEFNDKLLTIDEANSLYLCYTAEGDTETATTLQALISTQKDLIREEWPDEEE